MKRRIYIGSAALAVAFLLVAGFVFMSGPGDPVYQGKRLSKWIEEAEVSPAVESPPSDALRHYGKSAEPLLKAMLRSRDTKLELAFYQLLSKQSFVKTKHVPAYLSQVRATRICNMLGLKVSGTVPALTELVDAKIPYSIGILPRGHNALNVLALMGPDGTRALIHELGNKDVSLRTRSAELLGTAPASATPEVVAALKKVADGNDALLKPHATRALELLRQRMEQTLPANATNWVESAGDASGEPYGVWNMQRGTRILSTSALYPSWRADDMFGGRFNPETGNMVFNDNQPEGATNFVEWETREPVTIKSFGLIAGHDPADGGFQRAFRRFRLLSRPQRDGEFTPIYSEEIPVPYGQGHYGGMLFLYRNLETPVTARQFRAEFVQYDSGAWHGSRVVELFGFGNPLNWPMVSAALQSEAQPVQDEAHRFFAK